MNLTKSASKIARKLLYYPGWRSSRKIVVIESDDWGSISLPGPDVFRELQSMGIDVESDPYCTYDGPAAPEDLRGLFTVLSSIHDRHGNHPVITANTVVANPDFEKIRASNFETYHYRPFTETLQQKTETASSFDLWEEGMQNNLFRPQFHGREHLQIAPWMEALRRGNGLALAAFNRGVFAVPFPGAHTAKRNDFRAAFDCETPVQLEQIAEIVSDGLSLFEQIFGYRSASCIAPCYTWHSQLEPALAGHGISALQGIAFQKEPVLGKNRYKKRYHYTGKFNRLGQCYTVRNVFFEPSMSESNAVVEQTLKRVGEVFKLNKPAIIGSHRLNYIGRMVKENRERNLRSLDRLLNELVTTWPEIEFMSTDELATQIATDKTFNKNL
ncbi:MAG: hypothetical protein R3281_09565 [Balneolaceae bacterium]|nr:hypothetical protein [Balneolaceae bacterium]